MITILLPMEDGRSASFANATPSAVFVEGALCSHRVGGKISPTRRESRGGLHLQMLPDTCLESLLLDEGSDRHVFDGDAKGLEPGYVLGLRAPLHLANDDLPKLVHR